MIVVSTTDVVTNPDTTREVAEMPALFALVFQLVNLLL